MTTRRAMGLLTTVLSLKICSLFAQTPSPGELPGPIDGSASQKPTASNYSTLQPEQKKLVDDYVRRYAATMGTTIAPQEAYDSARMSVRTTFDSVTHALLRVELTDAEGKKLGRAIDLVDAVDEVMGEEAGAGGDRQFRLYVYLKPTAIDALGKSTQFFHDRDN